MTALPGKSSDYRKKLKDVKVMSFIEHSAMVVLKKLIVYIYDFQFKVHITGYTHHVYPGQVNKK